MYIPDNYDLFNAHEQKQQAYLDSRPKCVYCDEPITDEHCYDLGDGPMCMECLNEYFRRRTESYETD